MTYGNYAPFYNAGYYNPMPTPQADNNNAYYPQHIPQGNMPNNRQTQVPMSSDMVWVQGEAGAKAYLVAPKTTVTLWDSERKTIYLKSCNEAGIPTMKVFDYTERAESGENLTPNDLNIENNTQPTLDKINALDGRFDDILSELNIVKSKISELSAKSTVKNSKKSEE